MIADFNLPTIWQSEDDESNETLRNIDTGDKNLVKIIQIASEMSAKERGLALLMLQAIAAWNTA